MAASDILAIAQRHLFKVKRVGNQNAMAICPFHTGKTGGLETDPSFSLSLTSGLWICFACKAKGNLRILLQDLGIPGGVIDGQYKYAIEDAASYAPAKPDPLRPHSGTQEPLPNSFLGLFDMCPNQLIAEGFEPELLRAFDVGYDEAHHRITYPMRDLQGNLLGINGRTVIDENPRFKIYEEEYLLWGLERRNAASTRKRALLWNGHRIYKEVFNRTDASVVVVEGFKACMWLAQMGVTNVVALMGSHLTDPTQWALERMGATVYLMLDNDKAGLTATPVVAAKISNCLNVRMVEFDLAKIQPSDLAPDEVVEALETAKDYHLWAIQGGNKWRLAKMQHNSQM